MLRRGWNDDKIWSVMANYGETGDDHLSASGAMRHRQQNGAAAESQWEYRNQDLKPPLCRTRLPAGRYRRIYPRLKWKIKSTPPVIGGVSFFRETKGEISLLVIKNSLHPVANANLVIPATFIYRRFSVYDTIHHKDRHYNSHDRNQNFFQHISHLLRKV